MSRKLDKDTAKLVLTIIIIELVSGFTQGYYEPLIPKFGLELGVDASGLQLFNVIPTALAAILVPFFTRMGDIRGYRFILRIVIPSVLVATVLIWAGAFFGSWALVLVGRRSTARFQCGCRCISLWFTRRRRAGRRPTPFPPSWRP